MPAVRRNALVPYTTEQMFDLVNDVESYPEFLPWCEGCRIISHRGDEIRARLDLAKGGIRKAFTTSNRVQPGKMIEIRLVEGPFRLLEGFWRFDQVGERRTRVSLDLEFEFSNRLAHLAFGPVFHQIANSLVEAFCKRAHEVYGRYRNDPG
ncbi:MAG: type II toxin-antitoxin system RatA family toxin [Gammaproteobacteria bacterium]